MDGLHVLSPADDRDFVELRSRGAAHRRRGRARRERLDAVARDRFPPAPRSRRRWPSIWREGRMAIWPAAGVPQPTRSHFEAQAIMGWARGARQPSTRTGWLAAWAEATGGSGAGHHALRPGPHGGGADRRPAWPGSADPGARAGDAGRRLRRGDARGVARQGAGAVAAWAGRSRPGGAGQPARPEPAVAAQCRRPGRPRP